jgi:hypothetical protein
MRENLYKIKKKSIVCPMVCTICTICTMRRISGFTSYFSIISKTKIRKR